MRRRLYFLLPHLESARTVHDELLLARIEERHIRFLARDDIDLKGLPQASLLQKSDLVHGLQIGLIYGGLTGIFAGLAAIPLLDLTLRTGGIVVLGVTLAGSLLGAWSSSMIGVEVPNSKLKPFAEALKGGAILLMIDVPKGQVEKITDLIRRHHPEADVHGVEPSIPAFP